MRINVYKYQARAFIMAVSCILLTAGTNYVRSQPYSSVHYDTKSGLPSNVVYDVTQDKDGFIWFATEGGLTRFDGKNFKTFTTRDGLPDNSILKVHGDNQGRLLFAPFTHGIYYYKDGKFSKIDIPEKYKAQLTTILMFRNKRDTVIISDNKLAYLLIDSALSSFHDLYKGLPLRDYNICQVYDTLVVLGSDDSLFYVPDSGKVRRYEEKDRQRRMIAFDKYGRPLQLKKPEKNPAIYLSGYINDTLCFRYDNITVDIFNTSIGSVVYRIEVDKFSKIFVDSEGNLWITTLGNGVYRYPSFRFIHVGFDPPTEIFSLVKSGQQIIAGSDFSTIYMLKDDRIRSDYTTLDLSRFINMSGNPVSRSTKRNRLYVFGSEGDNLYMGADAFLLKKSGVSVPLFRNIFPIKDIDIKDSELLVCTAYYVLLLDASNMTVKDTLLKQRATAGVAYKANYYVGTLGGLVKIDPTNHQVTALYTLFAPFKTRITSLKRGIHDDLWIATSGAGLVHFKDGKILRTLRVEDGLSSDICTSLFIDGDIIWLGTNNGLNRIETANDKIAITRFTSANGLGADFINTVLATDSSIYVGTTAGLTVFNKNVISEHSICILHILGITENGKQRQRATGYSFPYNAINIRIDFTAISFKSAGDITYYYQLEGLENDWNTTTSNFINFPVLEPNDYTLVLKAVNKFGVESETKRIPITIRKPWWQTWVFRIATLLTLGLLIAAIYWYNITNVRRKEEMKREFETRFAAMEQKALASQMNPQFIFNSLNSIKGFILNLDVEGANNYLTNFASLIRQTLENSMHPLITLSSELKYLDTYLSLEKLRLMDKFRFMIHVGDSIDPGSIVLPGMLLHPFLENSIQHGIVHRKDNNGLILLEISKTADNCILYAITDNGIHDAGDQGSRGASIHEKRIAAINMQFKTNIRVNTTINTGDDGKTTGRTVTVIIPHLQKQLN